MDINQAIRTYAGQPLTHQLLMSLLKGYKSPNDKIHAMLNEGILTPIKKGLYIAGPVLKINKPEPFLIANHLLGPSYISLDSALSYYGLIPERVYEISSVTPKARRKFTTTMGVFSYTHLTLPWYSFGIRQLKLSDEHYVLIASPEKALFDKVITTSGVILRSIKSAESYLVENLRMDEEDLKNFNTAAMSSWLNDAQKKDSLSLIIKYIESLC
jgi:predicted transcriptional regulator of viral defense system